MFTIDASDLSSSAGKDNSDSTLHETATYLHDVLLLLQHTSSKTSKSRTKVLIAANKSDLFTALPPTLVQSALEKEITVVRRNIQRGLMDSGAAEGDGDERGWLGDWSKSAEDEKGGRGSGFKFSELQ